MKLKMRDVINKETYKKLTPEERRHILKWRNMCYYTIKKSEEEPGVSRQKGE